LQPALRLDAQTPLGELTLEQIDQLDKLQQTGMGNPPVQCCVANVTHHRPPRRIGSDGQHARFWITDGSAIREAIWWNAREAALPADHFDLAFAPQSNQYNGVRSVQLKVLDWRAAGQGE
jgi:single-stranded-DNA-specific exonuclease